MARNPQAVSDGGISIELRSGPGRTRACTVTGQLDLDSRMYLDRALGLALRDLPARLVVDLAGVDFCDFAALHVLLQARQAARACGAELVLSAPSSHVLRLLELTGMETEFTIGSVSRSAQPPAGGGPQRTPLPRP